MLLRDASLARFPSKPQTTKSSLPLLCLFHTFALTLWKRLFLQFAHHKFSLFSSSCVSVELCFIKTVDTWQGMVFMLSGVWLFWIESLRQFVTLCLSHALMATRWCPWNLAPVRMWESFLCCVDYLSLLQNLLSGKIFHFKSFSLICESRGKFLQGEPSQTVLSWS